jgi:hypothetical protein
MEQRSQDWSLLLQKIMAAKTPRIPNKPPHRVICSCLRSWRVVVENAIKCVLFVISESSYREQFFRKKKER